MATFYLLPPRACLDEALGGLISKLLPGLPLPVDTWDVLIDRLATAGGWPDDVYLVPRDDLPEGLPPADALTAVFGAEPGDRVIEVGLNGGPRTWAVPGSSTSIPPHPEPRSGSDLPHKGGGEETRPVFVFTSPLVGEVADRRSAGGGACRTRAEHPAIPGGVSALVPAR